MKRILGLITLAAIMLASCKRETIITEQMGSLCLEVKSSSEDYITKANDNVNDFVVEIVRKYDGFKSEYLYSEIQGEMISLGQGGYTIKAHSPEFSDAAWDLPFYSASEDFEVVAGNVTPVSLVCTLANVKVTLTLSENFVKELDSYDVTVSNGFGSLIWQKNETVDDFAEEKAGYFSVANLFVYVTGYRTIDKVTAQTMLSITDVKPRDHHVINIDAKVTGQIGGDIDGDGEVDEGIKITIDDKVNRKEDDVFVDGLDEIPVEGGGESGGEGGEDGPVLPPAVTTAPTLEWEANPDFAEMDLPMSTDAVVDAELLILAQEGVKEFLIYVDSPVLSETIGKLTTAGTTDENGIAVMDLINDDKLCATMTTMEIPVKDQILNQTSIPFSLSGLIPLINMYASSITPGDKHSFRLYVVDNKDQVLEQTVTFVSVSAQ